MLANCNEKAGFGSVYQSSIINSVSQKKNSNNEWNDFESFNEFVDHNREAEPITKNENEFYIF